MSSTEHTAHEEHGPTRLATWKRGALMLFFLLAFEIARFLLQAIAVVQFLSLLVSGGRNGFVGDFACSLGTWMNEASRFQGCETEEMPFPFAPWPTPARDRR